MTADSRKDCALSVSRSRRESDHLFLLSSVHAHHPWRVNARRLSLPPRSRGHAAAAVGRRRGGSVPPPSRRIQRPALLADRFAVKGRLRGRGSRRGSDGSDHHARPLASPRRLYRTSQRRRVIQRHALTPAGRGHIVVVHADPRRLADGRCTPTSCSPSYLPARCRGGLLKNTRFARPRRFSGQAPRESTSDPHSLPPFFSVWILDRDPGKPKPQRPSGRTAI